MNKVRKTLYGWAVVLAAFSAVVVGCKDDDKPEPNPCALQATAAAEKNTITVTATGGTTPYQYKLNNGDFGSSNAFSGLAAGDYKVTVKDAKNCTATTNTITISACDASTLALEAKGEAYTITATATGGEGSYQYAIDGTTFGSDNTFKVNEAKAYTVTVKDAKGCTSTAAVTAESLTTYTDPRDEQTYKVVKIGDQVWLAENFRYETTEGSYCYEGANEAETTANCKKYGRLYTWEAAKAATPQGWHLPIDAEFKTLIENVGGLHIAGTKLKEGGSSGFNFLLAGTRAADRSAYDGLGENGFLWSANDGTAGANFAKSLGLDKNNYLYEETYGYDKRLGFNVRYIKD